MLLVGAAPPPVPPAPPRETMTIRVFRSTVIRMPLLRLHHPTPPGTMIEKRGPSCVPAGQIAGAAVTAPDAIDFVLRGGERMRAKLDGDCTALGFYGGFYLSPGEDDRICADRDVIRTRAGGECAIDKFRRLTPAPPPKP
jgi:hypothetical protein